MRLERWDERARAALTLCASTAKCSAVLPPRSCVMSLELQVIHNLKCPLFRNPKAACCPPDPAEGVGHSNGVATPLQGDHDPLTVPGVVRLDGQVQRRVPPPVLRRGWVTRTHALSLTLALSLSLALSHSLALSMSVALSHSLALCLSLALSRSRPLPLSLSLSLYLSKSRAAFTL